MRTTNTFGVHFIARAKKSNPNDLLIYVRITVRKEIAEVSLKRIVPKVFWDQSGNCIKGNRKLAEDFHELSGDVRFKLTEAFRKLQLEKRSISAKALKDCFLGNDQSSSTICDLMKYHNDNMISVLAPGTLKNYFTTERYVKLFLERKHRVKDMALSELNYQFINEFEFFLRKTKPLNEKNPLGNNGIMKHMERLRKMVTMATKMEWIVRDPFQQYCLRFQKVDKEFLTENELAVVEKIEFTIAKYNLARDLFVFSCYSGLAYIDLHLLEPGDIILGIDGEKWINTVRAKASTRVMVPLLPKAKEMLEKYAVDPRVMGKGRVFPKISNQKLNEYLRGIGKLCEIPKHFSFHMARHTFATTVTLANGVPIETVSKMLGHTKLSTTQIYARVLERKVSNDMIALRAKLYSNESIVQL
ncbi:MAG: site-specific recombinase XerD [Flaviaesturariibacter sp.]|nr:site-specific recombinase XerD [Flaviaesturariibacter sp.]